MRLLGHMTSSLHGRFLSYKWHVIDNCENLLYFVYEFNANPNYQACIGSEHQAGLGTVSPEPQD